MAGGTKVKWNDHYGDTDHGADGLITKGFRVYNVTLAQGIVVDVYVLHMDAEDSAEDIAARKKQLTQLAAYIKNNHNNRPVIILGDTNCRYTRDELKTAFVDVINADSRFTITDAWVELMWGGTYPTYGTGSMMTDAYGMQKGEIVDKVFYINTTASNLKLKANSYLHDESVTTSDHKSVVVNFTLTDPHGTSLTDAWKEDNWTLEESVVGNKKPTWEGEQVVSGTTYYMMNVGTGEYIKWGGAYLTEGVAGNAGTPIKPIANGNVWKLQISTIRDKYLGDGDYTYLDRPVGESNWHLEPVSGTAYQYCLKSSRNLYLTALSYRIDGEDGTTGIEDTATEEVTVVGIYTLGTKAEYIEGINNITDEVFAEALTLVDMPMDAIAKSALQDVVETMNTALETYTTHIGNGTASSADVEAWISALERIPAAVSNAKVSIEAYKPLAAQIEAAHAKAALYPQENGNELFDQELGVVEDKFIAGDYAGGEIAATVIAVKGITNRYLMADAVAEASRENPVDVTALIVEQASFEDNVHTSWIVSPAPTAMGAGIAEYSNTTFDIHQVLHGIPAGVYLLQAQAFYRYGSASGHYSSYNNGTLKRNAKLYITHSEAETQTADVMAISDDPSETHQTGKWSVRLYNGHPVPDDIVAASEAIDTHHKYMPRDGYNNVEITVTEIGDLTIGVKKDVKRSNDWTVIGGLTLCYLGSLEE